MKALWVLICINLERKFWGFSFCLPGTIHIFPRFKPVFTFPVLTSYNTHHCIKRNRAHTISIDLFDNSQLTRSSMTTLCSRRTPHPNWKVALLHKWVQGGKRGWRGVQGGKRGAGGVCGGSILEWRTRLKRRRRFPWPTKPRSWSRRGDVLHRATHFWMHRWRRNILKDILLF